MTTAITREEIWLVRISMFIGALQLLDFAYNAIAILKAQSGLVTVAFTESGNVSTPTAYEIANLVVGLYLASGGRLFSLMVFGRAVPGSAFTIPGEIPSLIETIRLSLRGIGIFEFTRAVTSVALSFSYWKFGTVSWPSLQIPPARVHSIWALEHLMLGALFLYGAGPFARQLLRTGKKPIKPPESIPESGTPAANALPVRLIFEA